MAEDEIRVPKFWNSCLHRSLAILVQLLLRVKSYHAIKFLLHCTFECCHYAIGVFLHTFCSTPATLPSARYCIFNIRLICLLWPCHIWVNSDYALPPLHAWNHFVLICLWSICASLISKDYLQIICPSWGNGDKCLKITKLYKNN